MHLVLEKLFKYLEYVCRYILCPIINKNQEIPQVEKGWKNCSTAYINASNHGRFFYFVNAMFKILFDDQVKNNLL